MHLARLDVMPLVSALLLLQPAGCVEPHYTSGRLKCAMSGRACPDDFYCAMDGRCWQSGVFPDLSTTLVDLGAIDLATDDLTGVDLAVEVDLSRHDDLAGHDLAGNPSLCSGLGVKMCEGFEGALNVGRWTDVSSNGTATIDTGRAYRGLSSLHLHTNAAATADTEPTGLLSTYDGLPIGTTIYLRSWAYFPSTTPTSFDQFLNFSNAGTAGVGLAGEQGNPTLNDWPNGPFTQSSTVSIPTDRWTCLQLQIQQNGANTMGTVRVFIDGTEVTDLSASNAATPALSHIYVGLDWSGNPANLPATDLWLDEIIIDDQPTTCAE